MNFFFSSGDAPFFFEESLRRMPFFANLWHGERELGQSMLPSLWIEYPVLFVTSLLSRLGLSWFIIDKLWWILVFIVSVYGTYRLCRFFGVSSKFSALGSLIYSSNTYIILLFDGGQLGVALAYGFVPLVLSSILSYVTNPPKDEKLKKAMTNGLLLAVLVFLDLRISYVFFVLLLLIFFILFLKRKIILTKEMFVVPVVIVLVNIFWLLPTIQYKDSLNGIVSQTPSTGSDLLFFSVADFPHSLSLLHPNYPENLFGRTYFFKPEFLLIPIIAFTIFLSEEISIFTLSFGLLALTGAFLGKGAHEPFGGVYEFLFRTIPGFFLFRDPTKWYVMTAVAYSLLIPQSLEKIRIPILYLHKNKMQIFFAAFVVFWLFTLRLVFSGKVNGNITPPKITEEYHVLKNILVDDHSPSRTLWLPSIEKFGYSSKIHPALSASSVFSESSPSGLMRVFNSPENIKRIESFGIKYIVVPKDIEQRIFLDDYMYNEQLRSNLIELLDSLPSIHKRSDFSELAVYQTNSPQSFFSMSGVFINAMPTQSDSWKITIPQRSEESMIKVMIAYDPNWIFIIDSMSFQPIKSENAMMNFIIPAGDEQTGILTYLPTDSAKKGAIITFLAVAAASFLIITLKKRV